MGFKVMGVDASGPVVTVGYIDDGTAVAELSFRGSRLAGAHLVEWVDQVTALLGPPDGLAVGIGPGSYTGVRIAVTAAKALAYGWRIPIQGVSSLAAWARAVPNQRVVVTSERRGRAFYMGYYWTGGSQAQPIWPDSAISGDLPAIFPVNDEVVVLGPVGQDPAMLRKIGVRAKPGREDLSGVAVALLGWPGLQWGRGEDPVAIAPAYLRSPATSGSSEVIYGDS